jgi:hypothetical protein
MESNTPRYSRYTLLAFACCILLGLSGCAARRLRSDFAGYENSYAETSNREMLLNLARLNNHDPAFFFKLGPISTQYKMIAAVGGNGAQVTQGTATGTNITGQGSTNLSYEKDPNFSFIPVNDDASAQLLMKPITPEMFEALFQQGWRADQLFRLLVDRIEFYNPTSKSWEIIRNVPDADNAYDYTRFLRVSALAYELQRKGLLILRPKTEFEPLADANGVEFDKAPELAELKDAQTKNFVYRLNEANKKWQIGQEKTAYQFRLNGVDADTPSKITSDMPELRAGGDKGGTALQVMLTVLANGFTIQPAVDATTSDTDERSVAPHLVMRSMIGVLTAAGQEQDGFADLLSKNPVVDNQNSFKSLIPVVEQRPVIRLTWNSEQSVLDPLVQLSYQNRQFMVTDVTDPKTPEETSWNRDLFRLISELAAQVTVDISKFPLPLILQ